jgi:hypothetical protein
MGRNRGRRHLPTATNRTSSQVEERSAARPDDAYDDTVVRGIRQRQLLEIGSYHNDMLPPHVLEPFLRMLPDAGPVFIEEMKAQAAHRRMLENKNSAETNRRLGFGQIGAFVIAVAGIGSGTAAIVVSNGALWAVVYAAFATAISVGGPVAARIFLEHNRINQRTRGETNDT